MAERRGSSPGRDDPARAAEVCDLVTALRSDFAQRDQLYQTIDETIHSEYSIEVPEAYQSSSLQIRAPIALNIVNTVTAALSVNPISVTFEPVTRGLRGQQNSEQREHFFENSWARQEQEARRPLLRLFIASLVAKGEGILKTTERKARAWGEYMGRSRRLLADLDAQDAPQADKDRYYDQETEEYKKAAPYPIATTDVLPETFYYWRNEDGFTLCAEAKELPYLEALTRYQQGLNSQGQVVPQAYALPRAEWHRVMSGLSTISMLEVWDYRECTYVLVGPGGRARGAQSYRGGSLVKRFRHGYGNPYSKTLTGPYFHAQGIVTPSRLPEKAGLGVLYGYLSLFPALDTYLTIQSSSAYQYGFPAFRRRTPPGQLLPGVPPTGPGSTASGAPYGSDAGDQQTRERIAPGYIYPYDIEALDMPKGGPDIDKIIAIIRALTELALPSSVQGIIADDTSGYALNQAAYLARLAWDPIVKNANTALGQRTGFESWLIEHKIQEPVWAFGEMPGAGPRPYALGRSRTTATDTVPTLRQARKGWLSIGPDDLHGIHRYTCRLDPETPSNRVIEVRTHAEMVREGFETRAMAIEALGGDPGEVERGRLIEALKQDPEIMGRLRKRTFQRMGLLTQDEVQAQQAGQQMVPPGAQGGPPGTAGMPTGFEAGAPNVYQPGQQGMPLEPPLPGKAGPTGAGPEGASAVPGAALQQGGQGSGGLSRTAPRPVVPGPRRGQHPLPGQ